MDRQPPHRSFLPLVAMIACLFTSAEACEVYGPTLLVDGSALSDAAAEACTTTCAGSSACVDLMTSQTNCGACGKTCETGCAAGYCTPTSLATSLGSPHGLLLNASSLYVANHGSINIQSMSKIDGTGLKNFASSQILPDRLATDGTTLFWTDNTNSSEPAAGTVNEGAFSQAFCNVSTSSTYCFLIQDLPAPYAIAVQGTTMFFTTLGQTNASGGGCSTSAWASSVLSCPTVGCDVTACNTSGGPVVIAKGNQLAGVAVDTHNIYWADTGAKEIDFCPQPSCAGGKKIFAQNLGAPFEVASDGVHVYFTDRSAGLLYYCPIAGCSGSPTVLASGLSDPLLIAVDASNVYVTNYAGGAPGAGSITSCALPACADGPVTIAAGLKGPYGIALDATYVYWTEEGSSGNTSTDGSVSKLKR